MNTIKNFTQMKKAMAEKREFIILDHWRTESIGDIRVPNVLQTNGVYTVDKDKPESEVSKANGGKGRMFWYGKAADYDFLEDRIVQYSEADREKAYMVMAFKFI